MKRTPILLLLVLLVLGAGWYAFVAFSNDADDTAPPAAQAPFTQADEIAMAQLACRGPVSKDAKGSLECKTCPAGSDFAGTAGAPDAGWTDDGVLTGSFTAPGEDEALMRASGCESHANSMSGDFLFRRSAGAWKLLRYAKGATAGKECLRTLWSDGRDAVICTIADMHQGIASQAVQLMTFDEAPPPAGQANDYRKVNFVVTEDGSGNCGYPLGNQKRLQFDKVDRAILVPSATSRPSLSVRVMLARADAGKPGVTTCPQAQPEQFDVTWKNMGDHFEAAAGFVALAAKAQDACCELTVTQRVEPARY